MSRLMTIFIVNNYKMWTPSENTDESCRSCDACHECYERVEWWVDRVKLDEINSDSSLLSIETSHLTAMTLLKNLLRRIVKADTNSK